ncbi:MAG: right-handed parallel beta-helix repeat-containing protein [Thermoplasmata archaeon]|nr:MAG: right-handed parallel beta-helix repeat-containing protein [Thermoplasmata archaeon]
MTQPEDRPGDAASRRHGALVRSLPLLLLAALALTATVMAAGAVIDSDTVIDTPTEWNDEEVTISANVTIAAGGSLLINGSDLVFDADEGALIGLLVMPDGELVIDGVTASAPVYPYFISSDGTTVITNTTFTGLFSAQDDEGFVGVVGGVVANSGSLTLENVDITSNGVGVSAFECDLTIEGLTVAGGEYGILMDGATAHVADATITDMIMAFVIQDSTVDLVDAMAERVNWTLWAMASEVTVSGMDSRPYGDHLAFENCTASVVDSYFYDGQEGAVALLGYMEVARCHFDDTRTAIEILYAEGRIVDTLVEGCADMSIVLSFVGYASVEPDFEFDNVTVRNGAEAALDIDSTGDVTINNLTIEGCGDGINVASSRVTFVDTTITQSTQCRPWGCSYKATGTGILVETSAVELVDVTITESNGPAVSAYWSYVNATRSSFVDGNASGLMLVYSAPTLEDCEISGNAWWGIESLGFDFEPEDLGTSWGNDMADVRMNMTINARVTDHEGKWLSHAQVTAVSGEIAVGPYTTGFEGSTQTYELAIVEWTDGGASVDYNPWTFEVVYGDFSNSTEVDVKLGLGQITLVVEVLRADLVIQDMSAPRETNRDAQTRIGAVVANQGNNTVESVILTFYYRDVNGFQRVIGETRVGPIAPGEKDEGFITWAPDTRGEYAIVAFVDVDDLVDEEDDDNNRAEQDMTVNGESENAPGPGAMMVLAVIGLALLASTVSRRRGD